MGWVVSSTPRPHFTPGEVPVPILQEAGWAPGPVWTGGKSRPHRDSIPDRPACSQSLYQLSSQAHNRNEYQVCFLGGKDSRCVGLTSLPPSCADCFQIWEPQPPGTFRASPGLYRDCFTFYYCLLLLPASFLFCSTVRPVERNSSRCKDKAKNPAPVTGIEVSVLYTASRSRKTNLLWGSATFEAHYDHFYSPEFLSL